MNDNFEAQKEVLLRIKHEINLLNQQVDFLLRNEHPLGLLDLDVMMNRTHTMYDLMCGTEVKTESGEWKTESGEWKTENGEWKTENGEKEDYGFIFKMEEEEPVEENPIEENPEDEEIPDEMKEVLEKVFEGTLPKEEENPVEENNQEEENIPEEESDHTSVFTTGDEVELSIPHLVFPEEEPSTENLSEEEPIVEDTEEVVEETEEVVEETEEVVEETGEEIEESEIEEVEETKTEAVKEPEKMDSEEPIPYEPVIFGNIDKKEDNSFELDSPETLGDKLQQEDHSLANKLQHSAVSDLRTAIGINDKFLFVNELFSGSMEKYNRSIDNLNDLKTLNGALIYMNELRIELQWNSSNEAYKKLLELVHRKYESQ